MLDSRAVHKPFHYIEVPPVFNLRLFPLAAALCVVVAAACNDDDDPTAPTAEQFVATLSGSNEVPAVSSAATGAATFTVVDGAAIDYTIAVTGLTGVTMAHIHIAPAGTNGGVVSWLLPPNASAAQSPSGTVNGTLATGRLTAAWIRGVSGAAPISLDSLKGLMRTGRVYVNIHTSTHGSGELRGQITSRNNRDVVPPGASRVPSY